MAENRLKLIWAFSYVPEGTFKPDRFGRWMVEGNLLIPTHDLKPYRDCTDLPATVARITMKGTANARFVDHECLPRFNCRVMNVLEISSLFNTGFGDTVHVSDDFEDCKQFAERTINFMYDMLTKAANYEPEGS